MDEGAALAGWNVSKHVARSKHCISHQQNGEACVGNRNFDMCVVNDDRDQREDN